MLSSSDTTGVWAVVVRRCVGCCRTVLFEIKEAIILLLFDLIPVGVVESITPEG